MAINHKDEQYFYHKDAEVKSIGTGLERRILSFCDAAMCAEFRLEKDAEVPVHSHPHTQISYIVEGRFRFTVGDKEIEVAKGDTVCSRNGIKHGVVCLEKGMVVDFFTPMREDFVKD